MENNKNEILEKWSKLGLIDGIDTNSIKEIYENQQSFDINNSSKTDNSFPNIIFPMVRKIAASTIAMGGWQKSKKQQLKEDRINKLRQLEGKKPNVVLEKDEFIDGLVSVQPMQYPTSSNLFYMDYKYENKDDNTKDNEN